MRVTGFELNLIMCLTFFFFKQKTAYEMRISDWSSDVCSSDLAGRVGSADDYLRELVQKEHDRQRLRAMILEGANSPLGPVVDDAFFEDLRHKIGRASCRERVCQYV